MLSAAYKPWSGLHANWRNHLSRRQGSTCHWEARVSGTFSQATQPVVADTGLLKPWGQYVRTDTDGKMKGSAGADGKSKAGR